MKHDVAARDGEVRVPELDVMVFNSWKALDAYIANYSRRTYQLSNEGTQVFLRRYRQKWSITTGRMYACTTARRGQVHVQVYILISAQGEQSAKLRPLQSNGGCGGRRTTLVVAHIPATRAKTQNENFKVLHAMGKQIAEIGSAWCAAQHTKLNLTLTKMLDNVKQGHCPVVDKPVPGVPKKLTRDESISLNASHMMKLQMERHETSQKQTRKPNILFCLIL
ncbi:hypothetical protein PHMEG_00030931 [Phytophthora megakarya]|uniref:Uncharacterized protein n=1 Tax=Phytophthora megakarya TaxID=4795 RepID=A0A225UZU5_9STRA|nr:hypothetical protein PHMEG_00030931 [Phytophthora megakarya]